MIKDANNEVTRKELESIRIAGIRMRGKYSQCGQGFGRLGRRFGRFACGKPFMLIYDDQYKENDADFEVCMPIRKGDTIDDIQVRTLKGGACLSTIHRGPYDKVGRAYERIFKHAQQQNVKVVGPCREIYIKGPGMIFRGNPKNYLTEVQMPIANEEV